MVDIVRELLNSMSGNVTRSSCLAPLQWALGICIAGSVGIATVSGPEPVMMVFCGLAVIIAVVYLGMAIYFAVSNPDNLRSEKYSIEKMAIERGLVGDDRVGLTGQANDLGLLVEPRNPDDSRDEGAANE